MLFLYYSILISVNSVFYGENLLLLFCFLKTGCCHLFLSSATPRLALFIPVIANCCTQAVPSQCQSSYYNSVENLSFLALFLSSQFQNKLEPQQGCFLFLLPQLFFDFCVCMNSLKCFSCKFMFTFSLSSSCEFILIWSILLICLSSAFTWCLWTLLHASCSDKKFKHSFDVQLNPVNSVLSPN